ncbi:MAG: PD40 domain-containing protein [Candidatus Cloacimonetes bacterium]|nr:PD40 domain-containing protein [Candidatus Cloacimonadota bacterium]
MNKLIFLILSILCIATTFTDESLDSFNTINFQGFLSEADTGVPINGTVGVTFWIHPTYTKEGDLSKPPYSTANILDSFQEGSYWVEQFPKINIKDGIIYQRIGVHPNNRLSTSLFETRFRFGAADQKNHPVMHLLVVPFGTNEETWVGPFNIDGTPYSVSSVATKGEDIKQGRLTIEPHPTNQSYNRDALLEVVSPDDANPHTVNICYNPKLANTSSNCPNPPSDGGLDLPSSQYTGSGLVIRFPEQKTDGSDFTAFDMAPTEVGSAFSIHIPQNNNVSLGSSGDLAISDVSAHITAGRVLLNKGVEVSPYKIGDTELIPANVFAMDATVEGEITVNEIDALGEEIQGDRLGAFDKSEDYKDFQIDPYVVIKEDEINTGTKVNSLTILPNPGLLSSDPEDQSQLKITGPVSTAKTAHVSVAGAGVIYAPKILSPIKDANNVKAYQVSADQITSIDSLVLYNHNENTGESDNISDNLNTPLEVDMAFDLLSQVPLCKIGLTYHQALRKDYCAGIDGKSGFDGTNPEGKYYVIDPCRGIPNSQLLGTPISCFDNPNSPNIIEHPNMQSNGTKYLVYKAHIHNIDDNATASDLIDIINGADSSKKRLIKDIMPITAVDSTLPQTLTAVNEFRNHDVTASNKIIVSKAEGLDVYMGADLINDSPIVIGSNNNTHAVSEIRFVNEQYCDPNDGLCNKGIEEQLDNQFGLNIHAGEASFQDLVSISRNVSITGNIDIDRSNNLGGDLEIRSTDDNSSGVPKPNSYVYIPETLNILGEINFGNQNVPAKMTGLINLHDNTSFGISEVSADEFIDRNNLGDGVPYKIDPNSLSHFDSLSIVGTFYVGNKLEFGANLNISSNFNVNGNLTAAYAYTTTYYDYDNPSFYATPHQTSYLDGLSVYNSINVTNGNAFVLGNLQTRHVDLNNGLIIKDESLIVEQTIYGTKIEGKTNPNRVMYPLGHSVLNSLRLIANGDLLMKAGDLTIHNGNLSHAGDAKFTTSHYNGILLNGGTIRTTSIVDIDNIAYVLDPHSSSNVRNLSADTISIFDSFVVSGNMDVQEQLRGDDGLYGQDRLFVSKDFVYRDDIKVMNGGSVSFHVDQTGRLSAKSLQLTSDFQLNNLVVTGNVDISGPAVEINADTVMHKMDIVTHSIRSEDILAAGSSNPVTYFTIDPDGNLTNFHDITYDKSLTFSDTIHVTEQSGDTLQFSDTSDLVTSVYIGQTAHKELVISGLAANQIKATTGYFRYFEDRDNSSFYLSPSTFSNIQTLQLSSSLSTENTLTAPQFLDLDNDFLVDLNQHSKLNSLQVLDQTTAEWVKTPHIHINSDHQTTNTTIIGLDTFHVQKANKITYTGTSKFHSMALSVKNTEGIIIADNFSSGSGILMTPGDLNVLTNHLNADYLHRHDKIGGVSIENIARQDIDNSIPTSESTSTIYRAFLDQSIFTSDGLVLSIEPTTDSGTKPLLLVRTDSGSTVFSAMSTGGVHAVQFIGDASGVSNIGGDASTNDAIIDLSIENIKLKNNSLNSKLFTNNSIRQASLQTSIFLSRHFQEDSLSSVVIKDSSIFSENLDDEIIQNIHIANGEIDGTLLIDGSIQSYHINTLQISNSHIQPSTLTGELFAHQSITTDKILDNSVRYDHVSTGAIDSIKILLDSLSGDNFADKSISTAKIKDYTIISSRLKALDLTNSDFGDGSINSIKIDTNTIVSSNISSNTLTSSVFAMDSIDYTKIVSQSIATIDIDTNTIVAAALSANHKFADKIISSLKVIDRSIIGEHFVEDNILLSHLALNTVDSNQITTNTIAQSDILTKTIRGTSIQNLSIQSHQIDDSQIIATKIAEKVFESSSISQNTLTSQSFEDASITNSKIASNTLDSMQIKNSTLIDQDFAANSLTLQLWQTNTISSEKLANESIILSKFATNAVISSKVLSSEIQTAALSSSQIVSVHIAPSAIVTDKILNASIQTIDLRDDQIDTRIIAPQSIYSTNIIDLSIINSLIPNKEITSSKFALNSVSQWKIQTSQISTIKLSDFSIETLNINTDAVLSSHIDSNVISARMIVDQQILTTHIIDLAVLNNLVSDLAIGTRITTQNAIHSSLIESFTLTSSDFAHIILSDSHFASNSITNGEISNLSISYDLFKTHTIENRHIVPLTITSASLESSLITSSKIKLSSLSSEDFLNQTITDEHLDMTALPQSVFAQSAITSGNILNLTILQEDINDAAILSSHINSRAIESDHFADSSILTTHILDFTLTSSNLASASVSNGNLQTRVSDLSTTQGFYSLSDSNQLTNIQKAVKLQNGKLLLFDKLEGIFEFGSASKNTLVKQDNLTPTSEFTKALSIDKKVWVLVDKQKLYLSTNQGAQFALVQDFGVDIYDFHFEDEFHGVFISDNTAWMTYDSALSLREIRKNDGSGFRRVYSLNSLQHIWIVRENGASANFDYSSTQGGDSLDEYLQLNHTVTYYSDLQFQMTSLNNGQIFIEDRIVRTTDNWNVLNTFDLGGTTFNHIWMNTGNIDDHVAFAPSGSAAVATGFGVSSRPMVDGALIDIIDTVFIDKNNWYLIFKVRSNNDISIAKTSDNGSTYSNYASFGTADSAEAAFTSLQVLNEQYFTVNNAHRNYLSTDNGETFNAVQRSEHLTNFEELMFVDSSTAYGFDRNRVLYKSSTSGSTFSVQSNFGGTGHKFLFKSENDGVIIMDINTNAFVTSNGFSTQTARALASQPNDLNYGSAGKVLIGGDASVYSILTSDFSAASSYTLSTAGVSISAISSDYGDGIWFGSSAGKVFYVTSAGGPSQLLTDIGEKVQDISAISNEIALVSARGQNTLITYDGGKTWEKVLNSDYDDQLFTACHISKDKSIFLAGGKSILMSKFGEGIEQQKIANRTLLAAKISAEFDQKSFVTSSIAGEKLAANSISESSYLTKALISSLFASNSVSSVKISSDAISTRVIAFESVTKEKIRSESIYGDQKITTDTLTGDDFASLGGIDYPLLQVSSFDARLFTTDNAKAIQDSDIQTEALNTTNLDFYSFHGSKIQSEAISANNIKDNAIFGIHFQKNTLTSDDVSNGTFSVSRILPQTITSRHIINGEVKSNHFSLYEYWNDQIDDLSIQESSLLSNSFEGKKFKTRAFIKQKIKDHSIIHQNILNESVEANKILSDSITLADFELLSLTNDVIKSGTINAALLDEDSIIGQFVVSYDIETSKINDQAVSGVHIKPAVITNDKIASNSILGEDITANTLTQSKIKTLSLTDGHFNNLSNVPFATGTMDTTKARLYQSNGGSLYVTQSNGAQTTFASIGGGITRLISPSVSPDNSKIAFIANGNIHWSDLYLEKIIDTGVPFNGDSTPFLTWKNTNDEIMYYHEGDQKVYSYNLHDLSTTEVSTLGQSGFDKLVFAADDTNKWAHITAGTLAVQGGDCNDTVGGFNDINITKDGSYLIGVNGTTVGACAWGNSFIGNSWGGVTPLNPMYLGDKFYYFDTNNLYESSFSNVNQRELIAITSHTATIDKTNAFIQPAHNLKENAVLNGNITATTLDDTHLAELTFHESSFNGQVIEQSHLQVNSIEVGFIATNTITDNKIENAAIEQQHLQDLTLQAETFTENSIFDVKIAAETISSNKVVDDQILISHLAANSVTSGSIADKSILTTHLINNLIDSSSLIQDNIVTASFIASDAVSTFHIVAGSILTTHIADLSIKEENLAYSSITNTYLESNIFQADQFQPSVITNDKLIASEIKAGDAFIVTIEGGDIYRYDWDGSNRTLVDDNATDWTHLQKSAHGNKLTAMLSNDSYDIDFINTGSTIIESNTTNTFQIRDRLNNKTLILASNGDLNWYRDGKYLSTVDTNVRNYGIAYHEETGKIAYSNSAFPDEMIINTNGSTIVAYTAVNTTFRVAYPSFSKDGSSLYFIAATATQGRLKKYDGVISNLSAYDANTSWESRVQSYINDTFVYYTQNNKDLYRARNVNSNFEHTLMLDSGSDITDFQVMPFSAFANNTFTHTNVSSNAITTSVWSNRVLTGGNFTDTTIDTLDLEDNSFEAEVFLDSAFTTSKFTGFITTSIIASRAISSRAILDGSIENDHIEDNSFATEHFAQNTLDTNDLSGANIDGEKLEDFAVTGIKVDTNNEIQGPKIAIESVANDQITSGEIFTTHIKENTLIGEDFGLINASAFASNSISSTHFLTNEILAGKITLNTLDNSVLKSSVITPGHINLNVITSVKVDDGTIIGGLFSDGVITNNKLASDTLISANIVDGRVDGANMASDLDDSSILDSTLNNLDLAQNTFNAGHFNGTIVQNANIVAASIRNEKIADNAITASLLNNVVGTKIDGESFVDNAFGVAEIDDLTITSANISKALSSTNIGLITLEDTEFLASNLVKADFETTFATERNILDGSINSADLIAGAIIKSSGTDRLTLNSQQILSDHVFNDLEGSILENNAIVSGDIGASSLTVSKIKDTIIDKSKLVLSTIVNADFAPNAILNVHIPDKLITSVKIAGASFTEAHVSGLSGDEITDGSLSVNNVADNTIQNVDLLAGSFGATEIKTIEFADLEATAKFSNTHFADLTIVNDDINDNQVTGAHFNAAMSIAKFDINTITYNKLNFGNTVISELFGGGNADSHHKHDILTQEILCNGVGASKVGTSGNAFCIVPNINAKFFSQHDTYTAYTLNNIVVRGRMCTAEQLWRAEKAGISFTNLDTHLSSDFMVSPKGLGGTFKTLLFNDSTPDNHSGFGEHVVTGGADGGNSAWCF